MRLTSFVISSRMLGLSFISMYTVPTRYEISPCCTSKTFSTCFALGSSEPIKPKYSVNEESLIAGKYGNTKKQEIISKRVLLHTPLLSRMLEHDGAHNHKPHKV